MIRRFAIAFAAVAALGTASLAVTATPAAAKGWKHHHHGHYWHGGFRFHVPYHVYYGGCLRRVWVVNRFGHLVRRTVNVCY